MQIGRETKMKKNPNQTQHQTPKKPQHKNAPDPDNWIHTINYLFYIYAFKKKVEAFCILQVSNSHSNWLGWYWVSTELELRLEKTSGNPWSHLLLKAGILVALTKSNNLGYFQQQWFHNHQEKPIPVMTHSCGTEFFPYIQMELFLSNSFALCIPVLHLLYQASLKHLKTVTRLPSAFSSQGQKNPISPAFFFFFNIF